MKFNFRLEEIKYVKILYKDINGNPSITKAGVKKIDEREILACGKFEDGLDIETPQDIVLSVVCSDGLYRTKTRLKSAENEEPYVFFILDTPQGIEYEQNREYFRVPINYECIYTIEKDGATEEYKAVTSDISANGISLIIPTHVISESTTEILLAINGRTIRASLRYVRSEKVEKGYRLSFAYSKISEADRDFISQVCLQKQLEQRRYSLK